MGVLICVASFALALGAVLCAAAVADTYAAAGSRIVDPEGVGAAHPAVILLVTALAALSALFGARVHHQWLDQKRRAATACGAAAGVITATAAVLAGALPAWSNGAVAGTLFIAARATVIAWPAAIVYLTIAAARRR